MFRRILVPLDGTRFAERAVPLAAMLARASRGELLVAHVHQPPLPVSEAEVPMAYSQAVDPELEAAERGYLADVSARVRTHAGVPVEARLLRGDVAHALHDTAVASGVDLIVMTSHERGLLGRLFAGSVAERTLRQPGVPVLVVRRSEDQLAEEARADPVTAADPTGAEARPFRHVLIPLDGSAHAEAVLGPALALARTCTSSVTLVGVRDPLLATAALAEPESTGSAYLTGLAARIARDGVRADVRVMHDRDAAHAIARCAAERAVDVIAMTTHGRGALARMVQGGVATQLLRHVLLPVLLLNPGAADGARDEASARTRLL